MVLLLSLGYLLNYGQATNVITLNINEHREHVVTSTGIYCNVYRIVIHIWKSTIAIGTTPPRQLSAPSQQWNPRRYVRFTPAVKGVMASWKTSDEHRRRHLEDVAQARGSPMLCPTTIIRTMNTASSTRMQHIATATIVWIKFAPRSQREPVIAPRPPSQG